MKNNRFFSFALAVAIGAPSLLGLAAENAAAVDPLYNQWVFSEPEYYENFEDTSIDEVKNDWTFSDDRDNHRWIRDDGNGNKVLALAWAETADLSKSYTDGAFYYTYKIRMYNTSDGMQNVRLSGAESGIVVKSPLSSVSEYFTFTTVVDTNNKTAYTYNIDGKYETVVTELNDSDVTGIIFEGLDGSQDKAIWIDEISFGQASLNGAEPTPAQTSVATSEPSAVSPEDGLSYWKLNSAEYTENFDIESLSELDQKNWTYDTNPSHVFIRDNTTILQLRWAGTVSYNKTSDKIYYYRYNIRMTNSEAGNCTVSFNGISDGTLLSAPLKDVENFYWYTTVVDTSKKVAYTYDGDGKLVESAIIKDGEMISGITFASMLNTSEASVMLEDFEFGTADYGNPEPTETPTEIITETPTAEATEDVTETPTEEATESPSESPSATPSPEPTETVQPTEEPTSATDKLSYWNLMQADYTELFNFADTSTLNGRNWVFGSDSRHVSMAQNNGSYEYLQLKWAQGWAEYTKTPASGSFYYTYRIRMVDTSGDHRISLSGITDGVIITSPLSSQSSYLTFTTVVDIYSRKAYTYDETGEIVSETVIPENEMVTGIKFECLNDTSKELLIDEFSTGAVDVDLTPPDDIIVRSDVLNDGEKLENGNTYSITAKSFNDTVIAFDDPVSVMEDGSVPIYVKTKLEFSEVSGAALPEEISVSGNTITVSDELAEGKYNINITASSLADGKSIFERTYNLQIIKNKVTPDEIMNDYVPEVIYDGKEAVDSQEIFGDISIPYSTTYIDIVWNSDNPDIISDKGKVSRPLDDTLVTMTAVITSVEDPSKNKTYSISLMVKGVRAMLNDAAEEARSALVSADDSGKLMGDSELSDLHEDVKLCMQYTNTEYYGHESVVYTWSSDGDALKIEDGTARIYPTEVKKYNVNLILTVSFGSRQIVEHIPVIINLTPANAADKYAVRCDDAAEDNFKSLADYDSKTISSDLTVPTSGIFGSKISWTSSVPMYLTNSGKYTKPASNTSATLTGVVSRGNVMSEQKHVYKFTLQGKSISSGSGGGGGGSVSGGNSFTAPAVNISVDTSTQQPPVTQPPENSVRFNDLDNVEWAAEAINALADMNIISGKSDGIFAPEDNITRAEFSKIVVNAFGFADDNAATDAFSDVNENDWYYSSIAAAYNNGIINGYEDGTFGVNDNITRQDMAVIIYRAAEKAGISFDKVNEEVEFDDEDEISDYARDAVTTLQTAGIINGISDTEFAPSMNATRAQAAKMIYLCI